jgi:hypothetical protein
MERFVLIILLFLIIQSCAPVYVPNVRNAPLFSKSGEFQGSVQLGTSGVDLQSAVAVSNHIGLMGNFSYANRNNNRNNTNTGTTTYDDDYHRHRFYEGGIGYFYNDETLCYEVYAGYGQGQGSSNDNGFLGTQTLDATGKFVRYFLQPSLGFNKKNIHLAFTTRFSVVNYTEFSNSLGVKVMKDDPKLFLEPAFTAKFNFIERRLFAILQVGFNSGMSEDVYFDYPFFHFSTGLGFRLGGLRETISSENKK